MQDFKKLRVWQMSHALMLDIYRAADSFPREELYGLNRQLKDAAISVEANLAEGSCKPGDHEFRRFVSISLGSACEVESHLIAARDLKFLPAQEFERLNTACQNVRRMLVGLLRRLSAPTERPPRRRPRSRRPRLETRT
ncbi:MAG TPA: four helix bundle protein [Planctomycetota bacterium]|jgi:four helix bundle protein|nr:four helix bundle protein [Planctomycetota bacterium]